MGFATGFTGGVTLTLSLAYLAVAAHQRNREQQALILRSQSLSLINMMDPIPTPLPPSRSSVAAAQRETSVEMFKDRWNQEVLGAARWVQQKDWDEVREEFEGGAANLWAKIFGESIGASAERTKERIAPVVQSAKVKVEDTTSDIAAAAQGAFDKAVSKGQQIEAAAESKAVSKGQQIGAAAESKATDAKVRLERGAAKVEEKAKETTTEAKGIIAIALERGRDKAQELVGQAKATVAVAGDKAAAAVESIGSPTTNPVERALHQRYERPEAKVNRTVADVLKERYTPMEQRDNTSLRGL